MFGHKSTRRSSLILVRSVSTAVPAAAAAMVLAWAGLINSQFAAFPILTVQGQDSRLGSFRSIHGREREATRASGHFVHDNMDFVDRAMLRKHVPQVIFGN